MGAINSAFNQGLGSVVGALAVGKKLSQEKQIAEGIKAANEERAIELESTDLVKQEADVEESTNALNTFIEENPDLRDSEDNPLADRLAAEEAAGDDELPDSLTMRSKALSNLQKQQAARIAVRDTTKARIETLRGGKK